MGLTLAGLRGAFVGPIDLAVAAGECATISGPSGAGKSLLLRMIADLDSSEGDARLGDISRAAMTAPAWRALDLVDSGAGAARIGEAETVVRQGDRKLAVRRDVVPCTSLTTVNSSTDSAAISALV